MNPEELKALMARLSAGLDRLEKLPQDSITKAQAEAMVADAIAKAHPAKNAITPCTACHTPIVYPFGRLEYFEGSKRERFSYCSMASIILSIVSFCVQPSPPTTCRA